MSQWLKILTCIPDAVHLLKYFLSYNVRKIFSRSSSFPLLATLQRGLSAIAEHYVYLQPKPKTVPEFSDVTELIWFALPEKAIDNAAKDYHKQMQSYVSANGGQFDHIML